jgi:type I restriction enzyme S subunit
MISLPMPPTSALMSFESIVGSLFEKIKANVQENRCLAQTRDLLLPKLMSGEVHIRNAEKMVEAVA